ncbi:MAG: alpha/beta hydrolase family protein [Terriglobales bacterium]
MIYRARFGGDIVAEFAVPTRRGGRVIVLFDGMPSLPRKQPLMAWLAARGFWVIYPRWRGCWESGGEFLRESPEMDLSTVLDELPRGLRDPAFGQFFRLTPKHVYVIGGSFGGTAALLAALDPRVDKVVANCPVVDWKALAAKPSKETSNPSYVAFLRDAFGCGYRLSARNWSKLSTGRFFNPAAHTGELDGAKILMFHAQDDPYIPWRGVERFARSTGARLRLLPTGGHIRTELILHRYWRTISGFLMTPTPPSKTPPHGARPSTRPRPGAAS